MAKNEQRCKNYSIFSYRQLYHLMCSWQHLQTLHNRCCTMLQMVLHLAGMAAFYYCFLFHIFGKKGQQYIKVGKFDAKLIITIMSSFSWLKGSNVAWRCVMMLQHTVPCIIHVIEYTNTKENIIFCLYFNCFYFMLNMLTAFFKHSKMFRNLQSFW